MDSAGTSVSHASRQSIPVSRNRIIGSNLHKGVNWSRSKVIPGLKVHSSVSSSRDIPLANGGCRCSTLQEQYGHGNIILHVYGAPAKSYRVSIASQHPYPQRSAIPTFKKDLDVQLTERPVQKKLGLSEEIVRRISNHNDEPEWMLQFRLDAFHQLLAMEEPQGVLQNFSKRLLIDFHAMCTKTASHGEVEAEESMDMDDVSFATTHSEALSKVGVIFCSMADAIRDHPELVRRYLGKVVPPSDNFFAALNSAVFVHGSFCFVPEGVACPMDISTYFLVDGRKTTTPFERTLIVCDRNAFVSSLDCTSPPPPPEERIEPAISQPLNAPVIELFCAAGAKIKHVTVRNWVEAGATSRDAVAQEELLCEYVSQRGLCDGARSKITWAVVEAGSGVTWQQPAVVLKGDGSVGECFSVTLTDGWQQADTGATMIHSGSHTRSRIVGKTISAGASRSCFRGVVTVEPWSRNARSQVQWDSILIGDHAESTSCPSVVARNRTAEIEERGSTSEISNDQVFYFQQRGIPAEKAVPAILTGFCDAVLRELPNEFESEVTEMVAMKIEEFLKGSLSSSAS